MTDQPIEPVLQAIENLLHRRSDLSTFLVHLTRDGLQTTARQNLLTILTSTRIEARTSFGPAIASLRGTEHEGSQRAVCFTETPLEHTWMMCQPIAGRNVKLSSYGLAFARDWARSQGVNPVWYQDITPGHDWLTHYTNGLIKAGLDELTASTPPFQQPGSGVLPDIFHLTPFWEQMGTGVRAIDGTTYRKDFSWEREWRFVGDFNFTLTDTVAIFVPEDDQSTFRSEVQQGAPGVPLPPFLDPTWSLEKMILALRYHG